MRAALLVLLAACFDPAPDRGQACDDWCPPPEQCIVNQCRIDDSALPNFAFVTLDKRAIQEQTLEKLDQWCMEQATEAQLPGQYRAWVSTSQRSAKSRFGEDGTAGWTRTDNEPFANTVEELLAGKIYYPLRIAEDGKTDVGLEDGLVATGTLPDGTVANGFTCVDFSNMGGAVQIGKADAGVEWWTATGVDACDKQAHIYCLGVGRTAKVAPPPVPADAKHAFLTRNPYTLRTRADADAICNNEAGVSGTTRYLALLATKTESVRDRFAMVAGPGWYRKDGVRLTRDMIAFEAPLEVAFDGITHLRRQVWFGAASLTEKATADRNCDDFTAPGGSVRTGDSQRSLDGAAFATNQGSCGTGEYHYYCAER